jgi:uncharacterized protein
MHSRIYKGWVEHRRQTPRSHQFRYRVFMMYLDLAELPQLFDGVPCWSARRAALARFKRSDFFGGADVSLDTAVRELVAAHTGKRPEGPIRLLTNLRYFGYRMNPVSFYYCFDREGANLQSIVAEITNTPWGERHQYVLAADGAAGLQRFTFAKRFHVSPFMPMDLEYRWALSPPGDQLLVNMQNFKDGRRLFDANLSLQSEPVTRLALLKLLVLYPAMTLKVVAGIYWQALKLWLKHTPVFDHKDPATE